MKKTLSAVVSTAMVVAMSAPAYSQSTNNSQEYNNGTGCSCLTATPTNGPAGKVVSADGDVVVSGPSSYAAAQAGTPLSINSEVLVNTGKAVVRIGKKCTVRLEDNSSLTVSDAGRGQLCVNYNASGSAAAGGFGALTQAQWVALGVTAAVGTAVAIGVSNGNGSDNNDDRRDREPVSSQ